MLGANCGNPGERRVSSSSGYCPMSMGFRPVLARGWHDQLGRTVTTILGLGCADCHADGRRASCLGFSPGTCGAVPPLAHSWPADRFVRVSVVTETVSTLP